MNPLDPSSHPLPPANDFTRRSFMKKSALTLGAVTILGRGIGFAGTDGFPGLSGTLVETEKTVTTTVILSYTPTGTPALNSPEVQNEFNDQWPENDHGHGANISELVTPAQQAAAIITKQWIHPDAKLKSSDSKVLSRRPYWDGAHIKQEVVTERTYVWGDP